MSSKSSHSVLLLGFPGPSAHELVQRLEAEGPAEGVVRQASGLDDALRLMAAGPVDVLILGPQWVGQEALDALERLRGEDTEGTNVVFAAGPDLEVFHAWVDDGRIDYLSSEPPDLDATALLILSAIRRHLSRASSLPEGDAFTQSFLSQARQLAGVHSPGTATRSVSRTLLRTFEVDRADCRLFDPDHDILWCEGTDGQELQDSAAAGITSFVARTGVDVRLEHVGEDPRYDAEVDNPGGTPDRRYLGVPVRGHDTPVVAVLQLLRSAKQPPFSDEELDRLHRAARLLAGSLEQLVIERRLDAAQKRIFRHQAVEHHRSAQGKAGQVLVLSPEWLGRAYTLLLAVLAAALLYMVLGRFHEYAAGPAAVRLEGLEEVAAQISGSALTVEVAIGDRVQEGQLLATFYSTREAAELENLRNEFESTLLQRLLDPTDPMTEQTLGALRAQVELAEDYLAERSLRAPRSGTVTDLRLRPGQRVQPGQVVLSLSDRPSTYSLLALLPGHYRPQLQPGMPIRLQLHGYTWAYQHLVIDSVGDEVLGPAEARRILDPDIADAMPLEGPMVLVRAHLPNDRFETRGNTLHYHDGMLGTAEVRTRSQRLIFVLVPGLEALFHARHSEEEVTP